jgi:hypothetical protein
MTEVIAFSAIAKAIRALIVMSFDGPIKEVARLFDLIANFGEVYKSKRGVVLVNKVFKRYTMEG